MNKWDWMLWCDLETTGLDPREDHIMEMACIITDDSLNEVSRYHQLVRGLYTVTDPYIIKMHTDNGLLAEVRDEEPLYYSVWYNQFNNWLSYNWHSPERIILAGSGVHFDKAFLIEAELFAAFNPLHYRGFDTSTLKRFLVGAGFHVPEFDSPHRAMPDCEQALTFTREWAQSFNVVAALGI